MRTAMVTVLSTAFMLCFWCGKVSYVLVLCTTTRDPPALLLNLNSVLEQPHPYWISTSAVIYYMSFCSHLYSRLTRRDRHWSIYLWTEGLLLLLSRTSKEALMKPDLIILSHFFSVIYQSLNLLFFLYERALACPLFSCHSTSWKTRKCIYFIPFCASLSTLF